MSFVLIAGVPAVADAAPNSKYQKSASHYDMCWQRTAERAMAKGIELKQAARMANSHCKKASKRLLNSGGSKYDIKDRQKSLRESLSR